MQCCEIYLTGEALFVLTQHETRDGICVTTGPMAKLSRDSDDALLGQVILLALERSRRGIEPPSEPRAVTLGIVRFVGARGWAGFAKSAQSLSAEARENGIRLVPYRRLGDSFEPMEDRAQSCGMVASQVGRAARSMLESEERGGDATIGETAEHRS